MLCHGGRVTQEGAAVILLCGYYLAWLDKTTLARGCGGMEESGEGVRESDKAGQEDKWSRE